MHWPGFKSRSGRVIPPPIINVHTLRLICWTEKRVWQGLSNGEAIRLMSLLPYIALSCLLCVLLYVSGGSVLMYDYAIVIDQTKSHDKNDETHYRIQTVSLIYSRD